jgi:hypothetical protein
MVCYLDVSADKMFRECISWWYTLAPLSYIVLIKK